MYYYIEPATPPLFSANIDRGDQVRLLGFMLRFLISTSTDESNNSSQVLQVTHAANKCWNMYWTKT